MIHLDLGHVGATGGNPPAVGLGHREDVVVVGWASRCAQVLLEAGQGVELAGAGSYTARHKHAKDGWASAYVAAHANAGGKDYALVLHDGTTRGAALARAIAERLAKLPGVRRVVVDVAGPPKWSAGSMSLITGVGCPGVVVEPGFLDCPAHAHLWTLDGQRQIGEAVAAGVLAWLGS